MQECAVPSFLFTHAGTPTQWLRSLDAFAVQVAQARAGSGSSSSGAGGGGGGDGGGGGTGGRHNPQRGRSAGSTGSSFSFSSSASSSTSPSSSSSPPPPPSSWRPVLADKYHLLHRVTASGVDEFAAAFTWLDDALSALLHAVEWTGLAENTLFLVTTVRTYGTGRRVRQWVRRCDGVVGAVVFIQRCSRAVRW
jgi:hypothetical protein